MSIKIKVIKSWKNDGERITEAKINHAYLNPLLGKRSLPG